MRGFLIGNLFLLAPLYGAASAAESVRLTILYDNYLSNESLHTAWGFSCLVEVGKKTILFDTGGSAEILLSNMATLGIDPARIEIVVLSHIHGDHVGGLSGVLELNNSVTVYLPASFPSYLKDQVRAHGALVVEVRGPTEIVPGVWSTGEMGTWIKEQGLVVQSSKGLVVITGCAHPGVVNIVGAAKQIADQEVHLVVGGFHMFGMSKAQVQSVINAFQKLGVHQVAPCHCSGDLTRDLFHAAYGAGFFPAGAGWSIDLRPNP